MQEIDGLWKTPIKVGDFHNPNHSLRGIACHNPSYETVVSTRYAVAVYTDGELGATA